MVAGTSVAPLSKVLRTQVKLKLPRDVMGKVEEVARIKSVHQIPMMMLTCQMRMIKARQECPNLSIPDLV